MCNLCNMYGKSIHPEEKAGEYINVQINFKDEIIGNVHSSEASVFIDTLVSEYSWSTKTVSYTFGSIEGSFGDQSLTNYKLFNSAQQEAAQEALAEYEKIINVNFSQKFTIDPDNADIVFRAADMGGTTAGWAFYPSGSDSDVTIDNSYDGNESDWDSPYTGLDKGEFGFHLFLHELGHSMGLNHPHDNASISEADDTQNASVMSYNSSSSTSTGGEVAARFGPNAPQTLMIYDIAALQEIYGANHNYNAGDDTYQLTGEIYVGTFWDGNGEDEISSSSYTGNVTLDLREGLDFVTHVGESATWNAIGSSIENATSGLGNDLIHGNTLDNILTANSGNDEIHGYEGNDRVFGNRGNDTIFGNEGDDSISAGKDRDTVDGGDGNDWLNGNNDNDIVEGQNGDDVIRGGKNDDTLYGGNGNDTLHGDKGNDSLYGGNGNDQFHFKKDTGNDDIFDFNTFSDLIVISNGFYENTTQLLDNIVADGNDLYLSMAENSNLTLHNVSLSTLNEDNFSLV